MEYEVDLSKGLFGMRPSEVENLLGPDQVEFWHPTYASQTQVRHHKLVLVKFAKSHFIA